MDSLIEPSSLTGVGPDTISISNVNLSLGTGAARVHILKDISLRVASGEAIGLIGPSGSGKSTLLMVMAGLERPDSGEVVVNGTPFNALDEDALARFRGRQVGIVFQSFHLIPTMTALENVAVPLELAGSPDAAERAAKELASVGLGERLHHYPTQLSAVANSSAWRWLAPWHLIPPFSSRTSRPAISMKPPASRSSTCSSPNMPSAA
ncbi:putative ABC-type transport system involved in lysophospholipase L1 biosynthesis ATPase subunit [Bradyrhizobium sp. AZCC 1614]